MAGAPEEDVSATLSQLEQKLVRLERELLSVAGGPPVEAPPMQAAAEPVPATPDPGPAIASELAGFRDHLRIVADDLVARVDALIARLEQRSHRD